MIAWLRRSLYCYHVVFPHEVRQVLPGHHLVLLSQLVHRHQLVAGRQWGLRGGVERSVRVERGGVSRPGSHCGPGGGEGGNLHCWSLLSCLHWSLHWSLHWASLSGLDIPATV